MVERADARQGLALRPPPDAAMARARRRSRTPEGRTERQSRRGHRPGHRPGKVRADAPRATRRAGYSPIKETNLALPQKGSTGVQGERVSFKKGNSLTAAGADVRAQAQGKTALFPQCAGSVTSDQGAGLPLSPHAPRRAGDLPPMPGSGRDAQRDTGSLRPERVTFFKSNTLWLE